jgi:3-hydroxyphenylacetate 6-hydroxylase
MCVASLLAHNALYSVFLHLISRFHILPSDGETVAEIEPLKGLEGRTFVGTPRGFKAKFIPRDGQKLNAWLGKPDDRVQL